MKKILFILFFNINICFSQTVNLYTFNEATGTTLHDRVGSNNGTFSGDIQPTWGQGWCSFVGDHHTTIGNWSRISLSNSTFQYSWTSNFSIIVIFRTTDHNILATAPYFIGSTNVNGYIWCELYIPNIYNQIQSSSPVVSNTSCGDPACTVINVNDGKWHIDVVTYSTNNHYEYLDGQIGYIGTQVFSGGNFYNSAYVTIGAANASGANAYKYDYTGDIRYFLNINKTLTMGEIQTFESFNNQLIF